MEIVTASDVPTLGRQAADRIAECLNRAIAERRGATLALSGGSTPWPMLEALAPDDVDWDVVHVFQVDERVAPDGDAARNWTRIESSFLDRIDVRAGNRHPMPVHESDAPARYVDSLRAQCGDPVCLDVVQLGLGDDGHTASLVPDDPTLDECTTDVAWSGPYRGHRRLTLTYPALERARTALWLVAGASKREMVSRLLAHDPEIPAGRLAMAESSLEILFADRAAMSW